MRDVGTPQVLLRIFSGPQAGAEAGLPPGSFVIGTDESCDIIFAQSGLEPRHLELIVKPPLLRLDTNRKDEESGSDSSFIPPTVVPLDGDVRANNDVLASGSSLLPGVPLFVGTICVALARPESVAADWNAVREALQALTVPQPERSGSQQDAQQSGQAASPEVALPARTDDKNVGTQVDVDANKVAVFVPDSAIKTLPPRKWQKSSLFTVFFVVAVLGLLIFRYVPDTDAQKSVQALRQTLAENGFEKIDILLEKHTVVLKGVLRDDDERARLLALARNMQYPVHLDIGIRQDRKNAIEAAFSGRGFQLEVTDDPAGNVLLIAGYMQDRLVEEWAFSSSRDDVPDFESSSAGVVQRRIRYAEDVATILQPALTRANLAFVAVRYLP
ncbi:MAG: type III secretion system inner membrane ring subunit SctD, partial [Bilophila sp.]